MPQQSAVILTDEERRTLETFVHRGKANARTVTRARILLKSAEGWSTTELTDAFDVCRATVTNVCQRFAKGEGWRRSCMTKSSNAGAVLSLVCKPLI